MPLIKQPIKLFFITLCYKLFSVLAWVIFAIFYLKVLSAESTPRPPISLFLFVEVLIGFFPAYVVWVIIFMILKNRIFKKQEKSFKFLFFIALALNFLEIFLMYGHFDKMYRLGKYYGVYDKIFWGALPDLYEVVGMAIESLVFVILYDEYRKKRIL